MVSIYKQFITLAGKAVVQVGDVQVFKRSASAQSASAQLLLPNNFLISWLAEVQHVFLLELPAARFFPAIQNHDVKLVSP